MAYDYDALYRETPNALGAPTEAFCDFFKDYRKPGARILDVGCGQGRDALFIARLGHSVVGVDLSPAGISDLLEQASREELSIDGHVADIVSFDPPDTFDVIVIDRTLHMLERADRLDVLRRLVGRIDAGGYLLIADEPSNLPDFSDVLENAPGRWSMVRREMGILFSQLAM